MGESKEGEDSEIGICKLGGAFRGKRARGGRDVGGEGGTAGLFALICTYSIRLNVKIFGKLNRLNNKDHLEQ